MPTLAAALQTLFPASEPVKDWLIRQDGQGTAYIAFWNPALGTQPTDQALAAVTDAQVATAVAAARDARGPDLAAMRDQADAAIAAIDTYLAIASPTNVQIIAELRKVDQRQRVLIKALKYLATALL